MNTNHKIEAIPLLDISDNIIMVPMIGIIDSVISQQLMDDVLNDIKSKDVEVVIVDIKGISSIDSAVASHLIKLTKATKLMGCESILSGISSEIAQTLVNLGVELGEITTTSTLKKALTKAFSMLGYELVRKK